MAARPESRFALESAGLKFVEPDEGISHLLDEFDINASDGEVAIVDRDMSLDPEEQARDSQFIELVHRTKGQIQALAFVDGIIDQSADSLTTEMSFDPATHPMLYDHTVDGIPVVPGTVMLELCQQTAELLDRGRIVRGVRDYQIVNGVRCRGTKPRLITRAVREADGVIRCEVTGTFTNQQNRIIDPARVYASATILTGDAPDAGADPTCPFPTDWEELQLATGPDQFDPNHVGTVYHGPSLARMRGIAQLDDRRAWFRIEDPQGTNTPAGMARPAILDAFLQCMDLILHRSRGTSQLPVVVGQTDMHVGRLDQNELLAHVTMTHEDGAASYWSVDCFSPDGTPVVSMRNVKFQGMSSSPAASRETTPFSEAASVTSAPSDALPNLIRPLLLRASVNVEGSAAAVVIPVNPVTDRFVSEHTLHKVPLLPAVMAIEMMAEASEVLAQSGERTVAIRNMQILNGIKCVGSAIRNLVVRCQRTGNEVAVQLFEAEQSDQPSMTATVILGTEVPPMETTIAPAHGEFMDYPYPADAPIQHGPAFQTLRKLAPWRFQGNAHLQIGQSCLADDFPTESEWVIDPAILDGALVACGSDAWLYYGFAPELPHAFDEIIVGKMPQPREACTAGYKCRTTFKEDTTTYDLVLQDSTNRTFMQVNGFSLKRLMPVKPGWLKMAGY